MDALRARALPEVGPLRVAERPPGPAVLAPVLRRRITSTLNKLEVLPVRDLRPRRFERSSFYDSRTIFVVPGVGRMRPRLAQRNRTALYRYQLHRTTGRSCSNGRVVRRPKYRSLDVVKRQLPHQSGGRLEMDPFVLTNHTQTPDDELRISGI